MFLAFSKNVKIAVSAAAIAATYPRTGGMLKMVAGRLTRGE
jgi:hypothetical protein